MAFEEKTPFGAYRQCRRCHVHMPATAQFFERSRTCLLGLTSTCRDCRNKMNRAAYRDRLSSLSRAVNA
jgi:hypothetical protein